MREKRCFLAFDINSIFDLKDFGREIKEKHITLIFFGNISLEKIEKLKKDLIFPNFKISPVGFFEKIIFLPSKKPKVLALKAKFLTFKEDIKEYRKEIFLFLKNKKIDSQNKEFLPHCSIFRNPFNKKDIKKEFLKIPFFVKSINFYESLGFSKYKTLFKKSFKKPFIEIKHTADIAFKIRGKNFYDLYINAFIALCFKEKKILKYFIKNIKIKSIEDVIINLNKCISDMDCDIGSSFKAVSFQSKILKKKDFLEWEMIVDV